MFGAFTLATCVALAASASLGQAFTYGTLGFAAVLVYTLLRR